MGLTSEWIEHCPKDVHCSNYKCLKEIKKGDPCVQHFKGGGFGCRKCATNPLIQPYWAGPMPDFDSLIPGGGGSVDIATAEVIKRGQTCIQVILHRTKVGLSVEVHAHPDVEDFMRSFGGTNGPIDVMTMGRYWVAPCINCGQSHPANPSDTIFRCKNYKGRPLMAYSIPGVENTPLGDGTYVDLSGLGNPIYKDGRHEGGGSVVNISYIRLVGISEGPGVTFGVRGVFSTDLLHKLRDSISLAATKFYIDYLRPVDLSVTVSTSELRL